MTRASPKAAGVESKVAYWPFYGPSWAYLRRRYPGSRRAEIVPYSASVCVGFFGLVTVGGCSTYDWDSGARRPPHRGPAGLRRLEAAIHLHGMRGSSGRIRGGTTAQATGAELLLLGLHVDDHQRGTAPRPTMCRVTPSTTHGTLKTYGDLSH